MRKFAGSLNMLVLDYLVIPIWAVFSALGNMNCVPIMLPVTVIFLILNYLSTRSATRIFLLDINLAAASVVGIILNSFLYIRFVYADGLVVTNMVTLIFGTVLFIVMFCICCLIFKTLMHKRNRRIISRMRYGYYDDDEDDEEDEEDEEEDYEDERDFRLPALGRGGEEGSDDDSGDGDDEDPKFSGPKFRVVKKK